MLNPILLASLFLVQDGRTPYSICISSDASPSIQRGAGELQRFLGEISGARLPVVKGVCTPPSVRIEANEAFGPEGFRLKTDGRDIVIAGGRKRGAMYGVYSLLEKLGCRWFARDLSLIPKQRSISVPPLDEIQRPAFEMRWPGITEAVDQDWAARNKLNGGGMPLDESAGGRVECSPCGHSFHWLIQPDKYFQDHPEYFALVDGQRRYRTAQLCLTNPDVVRLGIERILAWIKEHPTVDIVGVCQEDWAGWCECDRCRKVEAEEGGAHSGPIVRFLNALAEGVAKQYPDKKLLTYAYQDSEPAPTRTRPHPNVRIQLAPISACIAHPAELCPRNQKLLMDNLKGWARLTNQIYMYGYATNFAHFLYPCPDFDRLAADIPMFKRRGVSGVYYESSHQGDGGQSAEMRAYVMAKLMWNTSENADLLINEFMQASYGPGWRSMRAAHDLLQREVSFPPQGKGKHMRIFMSPWLPPEVL